MEKVNTLEQAKDFFLSHSAGSVVCVNEEGLEKECSVFGDAESFYGGAAITASEEAPTDEEGSADEVAEAPSEEVATEEATGQDVPATEGEAVQAEAETEVQAEAVTDTPKA